MLRQVRAVIAKAGEIVMRSPYTLVSVAVVITLLIIAAVPLDPVVGLLAIVCALTLTMVPYFLVARPAVAPPSVTTRMHVVTRRLKEASRDIDASLTDLARLVRERQEAARGLERRVSELELRNEALGSLTPVGAQYLAEEMKQMERQSRRRDLALFGLGVIAGGGVTVVLHHFGFA